MSDLHLDWRPAVSLRLVAYTTTPIVAIGAAVYTGRYDVTAVLVVAFAIAGSVIAMPEKPKYYLAPSNLPPPLRQSRR